MCYDVGRVLGMQWRPEFDPRVVHRELEIIKTDLHCNAVRVCGRDIGRLMTTAEDALSQELEVWFQPDLWDRSPRVTLAYVTKAATAAQALHERWPGRVVFSVGTELTLFMRGIISGRTFHRRLAHPSFHENVIAGTHNKPLNVFLTQASESVRRVFGGPITYAALIWEAVDWDLFDIISVDHYREERTKVRYLDRLQPLLTIGKPVVVTEFGMRAYQGAESSGTLGVGIIDYRSLGLHQLPVIGRFVRPRLNGPYVRDEALQAREIADTLASLQASGVDGAFVCTFVEPLSPYDPDPRHDLDMSALSLVKTCGNGRGDTYPDMSWEPKQSFRAVADFYAGTPGQR
ncbi:hypothetical protein [Actinoallomurus acaciae]|uniref:Abortive infection protein n=1 Tax=Actinoallomurus acaciae TaxID=502577 RepID=A0ABV5YF41_9ACTN